MIWLANGTRVGLVVYMLAKYLAISTISWETIGVMIVATDCWLGVNYVVYTLVFGIIYIWDEDTPKK